MSKSPENQPCVIEFDTEGLQPGSLRYDMLMGLVPFSNLLEECVERYLSEPEDYLDNLDAIHESRHEPPEPIQRLTKQEALIASNHPPILPSEGAVLAATNTWGLYGAHLSKALHEQVVIDGRWMEATVRQPELFSATPDRWVSDRLTAFGAAYIEDTRQLLGITVAEFTADITAEEQVNLLWRSYLNVVELGKTEGAPAVPFSEDEVDAMTATVDEQDRPYYDPLRLSPKAYPNNEDITPTCAAQMAMLAGLFEAAGLPHMTANTLAMNDVYSRVCLKRFTSDTLQSYQRLGLEKHPSDARNLRLIASSNAAAMRKDLGFHGCNVVRLNDGKWYQCDLTRAMFVVYDEESNERLDRAYDSLQVARQQNIPMTAPFNELRLMDTFDYLSDASIDAADRILSANHIEETLKGLGSRLTIDSIVNQLIMPILLPKASGQLIDDPQLRANYDKLILQQIPTMMDAASSGREFVRKTVRQMLINHAFLAVSNVKSNEVVPHKTAHDGQDCNNGCLKEALKWPVNRELLVTWIRSAPLMFYQKLATDLTSRALGSEHSPVHPSLELTNPAIHLGAMVLSTHAAIYADPDTQELPTAFWPTYNPNHDSLMHLHEAHGTSSEPIVANVANFLNNFPPESLLDTTKRLRIKRFLKDVRYPEPRDERA
jgi:hypothetical protein